MYTSVFFGHEVIALNPFETLIYKLPNLWTHIAMASAVGRVDRKTGEHSCQIFCNFALTDLHEKYQKAIIAHEVGHIELGHVSKEEVERLTKLYGNNAPEPIMEYELAADKYAADLGYGQELAEILEGYIKIGAHPSTEFRVAMLRLRLRAKVCWSGLGLNKEQDYNNDKDSEC